MVIFLQLLHIHLLQSNLLSSYLIFFRISDAKKAIIKTYNLVRFTRRTPSSSSCLVVYYHQEQFLAQNTIPLEFMKPCTRQCVSYLCCSHHIIWSSDRWSWHINPFLQSMLNDLPYHFYFEYVIKFKFTVSWFCSCPYYVFLHFHQGKVPNPRLINHVYIATPREIARWRKSLDIFSYNHHN